MKLIILASTLIILSCASSKKERTALEKKADLYYSRGTGHLMKKNYTKAIKNLLQANKIAPNNSKTLNNLGMAHFFKNDKQNAIALIQKSLKIDPKNTDARVNYASILFHEKKYLSSEKQYKKVLKDLTYEKQQRTHYNLGLLYEKINKKKSALKSYRQALKIDPYYCPANYKIALIAFKKKKFNLASKQFYNATKGSCYNNVLAHLFQARSLRQIGKTKNAIKKYELILKEFPSTKYEEIVQKGLVNAKNELNESETGLDIASIKEQYEQMSKRNYE